MLGITLPKRIDQWLKAAVAAFISSACNAGLAGMGIGAAQMVGVQIQQMNLKQFLAISLSGGLVGLWMYLAKAPVPPDAGNTDIITKP